MQPRHSYIAEESPRQRKLFAAAIAVSFIAHAMVFIVDFAFEDEEPPQQMEWAIDAELVLDEGLADSATSALPNAKISDSAGVPDNMLPQLPKQFKVKEEVLPEETIAEEKTPEKETETSKEPTEKPKEEGVKTLDQDDAAKVELEKSEALKRGALERLRDLEKKAEIEAEKQAKLARLANDLKATADKRADKLSMLRGNKRFDRYRSTIQQAVRRNFQLPDAYGIRNAKIRVILEVVLDARGNIRSIKVSEPSGNDVFDNLAYNALRASAPLPEPPKQLIGQKLKFAFDPQSI